MIVLAASLPDHRLPAWHLPLFVHVLGAMVLVGALLLAATSLAGASRGGPVLTTRLAFRTLLWAAFPAYIVMRVGAQLIADKEGYKGNNDPSWLGIGFAAADGGLLLLIIATVLLGLAARRAKRGGGGAGLTRAGQIVVGLLIVLDLVAVWAMSAKPG